MSDLIILVDPFQFRMSMILFKFTFEFPFLSLCLLFNKDMSSLLELLSLSLTVSQFNAYFNLFSSS